MSIQNKIEEIRRQPERVRLRYVWLFTAISMLLVFVIWLLSLTAPETWNNEDDLDAAEITDRMKGNANELKDAAKDAKDAFGKIPLPDARNNDGAMTAEDGFSAPETGEGF